MNKLDIFLEIYDHLLNDVIPSAYFNKASNFDQQPFTMLNKLKETNQSTQHHPEGNVWNHTMMVIDIATQVKDRSSDQKVFMWAALLHDIGKPDTTRSRNGKITSYNHEKVGAVLAKEFLEEFINDEEFIQKVTSLIKWHMQILFVVNSLPFAEITKMKQETDIFDVALLGFCDRLGRGGADKEKELENIREFIKKCKEAGAN